MPQSGMIFRVLIASPSDCDTERRVVPEVIHRWNATHSRETGAIMESVLWETHSRPEFGDRPQGIINRQLGEMSDILIGTFWTRLGTSTGVAESGTAEEIEEFRKAGKPVLLYFSQVPAVPETIDQDQFRALLAYKAKLTTEGLYCTYGSVAELRDLVYRHLNATIAGIHKGPAPAEPEDGSERSLQVFKAQYATFLRRIEAQWVSERDSDPDSTDEGKAIARQAYSDVINFRSMIVKGGEAMINVLDDAAKRLRALERAQMFIDGGVSWERFWEEGNAIIELLKSVPFDGPS